MEEWYKVKEISKGVYQIEDNGDNIIYLICGNTNALVIDTGWGIGDLKNVLNKLTTLPLVVINTHGHPDHVSGNYLFDNVYISELDKPIMEGCLRFENRVWALENVQKGPYPDCFDKESWLKSKKIKVQKVKSGQIINLGGKNIEVIMLSGHTPGGICLLDRNSRMLFSGDSILRGHIWLHLDHSASLNEYYLGLKNLKKFEDYFDKICPAHGTVLSKSVLAEYIEAVRSIIQAERIGIEHNTFVGKGKICNFGAFSIVYNGDKILDDNKFDKYGI